MAGSAVDVLRGLLTRAFGSARWLVEDLTGEEYFWEPVTPCWSVRRREDAGAGWGTGRWVCEDGPMLDPPPVTTIAWRVMHLAAWTDVYRDWTFGETRPSLADFDVPGGAAEGVAWLHGAQDRFAAELAPLTDADLRERRPEWTGEWREMGVLVREIAVEHLHHGAEIGVLRDLRRGHGRIQPLPDLASS